MSTLGCVFCLDPWEFDVNQGVVRRGDGTLTISVTASEHRVGRNNRFVCHPCSMTLDRQGLAGHDPDDLARRVCEECRGAGGIQVSKYSGRQQCYSCEGLGYRVRLKSPLEQLADAVDVP